MTDHAQRQDSVSQPMLDQVLLRAQEEHFISQLRTISLICLTNSTAVLGALHMIGIDLRWFDFGWLLMNYFNAVVLYSIYRGFQRNPIPDDKVGAFLRRMEVQSIIAGVAWGLPIIRVFGEAEMAIFLCASIQVAMATGYASICAPIPGLSLRYVVPCMLSAGAICLFLGPVGVVFFTLCVILIVAVGIGCLNARAQMRDQLSARLSERASHQRLRSAIEAIQDGFALVDAAGKVLMTNRVFRKHLNTEEALDLARRNEPVSAGGRTFESSVLNAGDDTRVFMFADVTERAERQARLETALSEAEAADESKARFLESMSHELRTPLNVVIGFSKLMSNGSAIAVTQEEMREYADHISASGEHLLRMVEDILAYSRLGVDHSTNSVTEVDLRRTLTDSIRLAVDFQAVYDTSAISVKVSKSLGLVLADELAVQRILIGLISNAIKFSSSDNRVAIAAGLSLEGRPFVSVRDWGAGMSEAELERAFDAFYQGDDGLNRQGSGTGLGLTLCRALARAQGGDIVLKSTQGAGTVATFILPAQVHRAPNQTEAKSAAPASNVA